MQLIKCSFAVKTTDDKVLDIGNATMPQNLSVSDLVASNPQYWLEKDANGNTHLCTVKTDEQKLSGNFKDGNNISYPLDAACFEVVLDFFGGHPKDRPKAL